jgi:hypothetical protein
MILNDEIDLEIRTAIDGGFILGQSKLAEHYLLSDTDLANDALFEWQSIIDQCLSISVKRGVDTYTGAYALPLPSVGVMHVRTVNRNLDPHVYNYLQPRSKIRLIHKNNGNPVIIFQGRVENLFVDYRSDVQKPLITFDVMDPIGQLQNTMTELSSLGSSADQTWTERINEVMSNGRLNNEPITIPRVIHGGGTTKHGYWEDNLTVWEALELANNTEGGFIFMDKNNTMQCYASEEIGAGTTPIIKFSNIGPESEYYDPTTYSYKNIAIDFNTESVINEVQVSNTWGYIKYEFDADIISENYGESVATQLIETKPKGPYRAVAQINKYGTHALKVDTNFHLSPDDAQLEAWANKVLNKWKEARIIVKEIEWDAAKNTAIAGDSEILDNVDIQYETDVVAFDENLTIVGIQHEINNEANTWKVKYILFPRSRFI